MRTQVPWTDTQRCVLIEGRALGMPYPEIAASVGHNIKSCQAMYTHLLRISATKPPRVRERWTEWQIARHLQIIEDHAASRTYVPWDHYAAELGHNAKMCRDRAAEVRRKRGVEKDKLARALIRTGADAALATERIKSPAAAPPIKAPPVVDHMAATSIAAFRFAAEMRARIGAQGITAGLLGDPPPGRSALDKKRREASAP